MMQAWLLDIGQGYQMGLSPYVLRAVLDPHTLNQQALYSLPLARSCCHQLIQWHEHMVPVMQLLPRISQHCPALPLTESFLAIIAIPPEDSDIVVKYIAVSLTAIPERITLNNPNTVVVPESNLFTDLACSYCYYHNAVLPILDPKKLK